jgi:pre-rRNA-processing protein TSR1
LPSPETASLLAALDLARICDVLLLVIDGNGPRLDRDVTEIQIEGGDRGESTKSGNNRTGPDYDHLVSSRGDRILAALKGQGLPTPITVLAHSSSTHPDNDGDYDDDHDGDELMTFRSVKSRRRSAIKRKLELKKYVSRFATTEFGTNNDRVAELFLANMTAQQYDTGVNADVATASSASSYTGSAAALVRTLCFLRCGPPKWVSECPRSYLLADSVRHDAATQHLHLTGYLRGAAPLNVNSLVHVPNLGTFAIHSVAPAAATAPPLSRRYRPPAPLAGGGGRDNEMEAMNANADISKKTLFSDPVRQESVNMFASPDALEGEQNLVGFDDEDMEGNGPREEEDEDPAPRPAGWSDYQAAWLDAVDDDGDDDGDKGAVDRGELARELNRKETRVTEAPTVPRSDATMATGMEIDLDDANDVNVADKETMLEHRRKEQKENVDFPDEVQVEADQIASERFARYRSLKSFRKSFWDPKENLPATYASIYHFSNFRATQRSILRECKETIRAAERTGCFWGRTPPLSDEEGSNAVAMEEEDTSEGICDDDESAVPANDEDLLLACVPTGSYVTVTLHDVQVAPRSGALVTAVSLLPHENKVSVLHMAVSRHNDNNESSDSALVKSKDVVTFRCGWRTWQGRPVFSQLNLNCDKHPLERFLPSFGAASVFGPVTYTPAPVLMFVGDQVVGMGSVVSADADRLVLKRIVLTGYPVKVHKRHAVVKYMFYNPGDVQWFQPAGLYTKHGLQGNIISSVGEHGTMKCLFHAPIKQHDTVCLPLYKRVYPKFVEQRSDADNAKVGSARYSLTVR